MYEGKVLKKEQSKCTKGKVRGIEWKKAKAKQQQGMTTWRQGARWLECDVRPVRN